MILVDSIFVNYGGAMSLLGYLIEKLQDNGIDFFLLADLRCKNSFDNLDRLEYMEADLSERKKFYINHKNDFSSVFCFGNVPPPIRLKVPVYTYFHNINMLTLSDCRNLKQKVKFWLKRTFIKYKKNNTDKWFVQTSNTADELIKHLGVKKDIVKLYPFYKLPKFEKVKSSRLDYIFVGEYSGSKGHAELLEAWKLLHRKGIDLTLHLTVSVGSEFIHELTTAIEEGINIINHGYINKDELAALYMKCKATIYPSYNESFGLGLVEAMEAGCDVLASDRPFVYSICQPSEIFEPLHPETIAEAVMRYETGNNQKTVLKVKDTINDMIKEITD